MANAALLSVDCIVYMVHIVLVEMNRDLVAVASSLEHALCYE